MRRIVFLAVLITGLVTLVVWLVSYFIVPIIPQDWNSQLVLMVGALLTAASILIGLKEILELFHMLAPIKSSTEDQAITQRSKEHPSIRSVDPVIHNLPQPAYSEFVGREGELQTIMSVLRPYPHSQNVVVTIDGIGGIGKTALALEVCHHYLRDCAELPVEERFDAIVWSSAKRTILTGDGIIHRSQSVNTLDDIYKEILAVLGGNPQTEESTRTSVTRVLTQKRTLLVIDNLETVDDESVLAFLRELPAPTKAIVTTRHRIDVAYPVRLEGLRWEEARDLIEHECREKSVVLDAEQARQLHERTGGVPLALVWSVALIGLGRDVPSVLHKLGNASDDISRFCFDESVQRIRGSSPHKLLMATAFLTREATRANLGYVTDLSTSDRDEGLYTLEKLSLVNKRADTFQMLPLTRTYAQFELDASPNFAKRLATRWEQRYSLKRILRPTALLWRESSVQNVRVPIGLTLKGELCHLQFGKGIFNNVIIAGRNGAGKTVLLNTIICSLASTYPPHELRLCLVDPHFENPWYLSDQLPNLWRPELHAQQFATQYRTAREQHGAKFFEAVENELLQRKELFGLVGVTNFTDFRQFTEQVIPRIVIVLDSFHLSSYVPHKLGTLWILDIITRSAQFGVHVIAATQYVPPELKDMLDQSFGIRIALSSDEQSSTMLVGDNSAARLTSAGAAIYNESYGNSSGNIMFQVAYPWKEEITDLLQHLRAMSHA